MSDLVEGFYPKEKHPNAPDFVLCKSSIKVADFKDWFRRWLLENPTEEWLNIDLKVSKQGKGYAVVDDWKPNAQQNSQGAADPFKDEDIPF